MSETAGTLYNRHHKLLVSTAPTKGKLWEPAYSSRIYIIYNWQYLCIVIIKERYLRYLTITSHEIPHYMTIISELTLIFI